MVDIEIQATCQDLAQETGLPVSWVRQYVDRKAGKPCLRCQGWGKVHEDTCPKCGGDGGPKGTRHAVGLALDWVRSHVPHIQQRIQKRIYRDVEASCADEFACLQWKLENASLWAVVEDMLPCPFKEHILQEIESGDVSAATMQILQEKSQRRNIAPSKGTCVRTTIYITHMKLAIGPRGQYFQFSFSTQEGWNGRVERELDDMSVGASYTVIGQVQWSKDQFAVLDISSIL